MIKIGYQGDIGSNSEEAAKKFISRFNIENVELVPLISSDTVINQLKNKNIDYAVVATKNSIGGTVQETFNAIKDEYLQLVAIEILPIHHCLFKKKNIPIDDIKVIASHIQALKQTTENRKKYYPNCTEKEVKDTAWAAQALKKGELPDDHAVLCRKNAGEWNNLELIQENLEDSTDNKIEFRIFKLPELNYDNENTPSFFI